MAAAGAPRIGCLFVPDLPLQAVLRAEPDLAGAPLAVAEGEGPRARIVAASAKARSRGVGRGLAVGDALGLEPSLVLRWPSEGLVAAAAAAVVDAATSVSPRVEEARPGLVHLDVAGLGALHRDDRGAAAALVGAAKRLGFEARAAVASGKRLAAIAAIRGDGVAVVEPGRERLFLGPLPLEALGAPPRALETLRRWGIRTAAELAALPSDGVGTRLGDEGVWLHRLASGEDDAPLAPRPPPVSFEEGCDLDFELASIEALLFVLKPAVERLVARLGCHGLACGSLAVRLLLDPSGEALLPVELAAPTTDVPSLLSLARAVVEQRPPGAAVRGVRLVAEPARARREQLRIFGLPTVAPEKLATAVAKVASLVGAARVGSPRLAARHEPEAAHTLVRFDPPPPPDEVPGAPAAAAAAGDDARASSFRWFRPLLAAEVRVGPQGPQAVRAPGVNGWVVACAGPWRLDVGWLDDPVRRDAYDVELSDGAVYRLSRDLVGGGWWLLGRYE